MLGEWLRSYGAAVGPSLAFLFGVATLFLKDRIERRSRRNQAVRLLRQLNNLVVAVPPPKWISLRGRDGYEWADRARGNAQALDRYHHHLLAVRSFLESNEPRITESGSLETIQSLYHFKWRFQQLLRVVELRAAEGILNTSDERIVEEIKVYLNKLVTETPHI